jgi:hypothetical protein
MQFVFGLGLIVLMLAAETLILIGLAWIVLSAVRYVPLVGRRHRHSRWDPRHSGTHAD